MNVKRAVERMHFVAIDFRVSDRMQDDFDHLNGNEDAIVALGRRLGLSKRDLMRGTSPIPDELYNRYPLFGYMRDWDFDVEASYPFGPYRILKAIFGEDYKGPDIPSKEEEQKMLAMDIRARCSQKMIQINELFPNTYPLDLPAWKFRYSTDNFISFRKVYEMVDSWDQVIQRFSELFFSAMESDLSEHDALELNLLSTFFDAIDHVMPMRSITYEHIQKYREKMKEENFKQFSSYVRIQLFPFWRAREFYRDPDSVKCFIEKHYGAKAQIRSFLTNVLSYKCSFVFINDMKEHEYRQSLTENELEEYDIACAEQYDILGYEDNTPPVYITSEPLLIEKTEHELSPEDRLISEHGKSLVRSIYCGGVHSDSQREFSDNCARMMHRMGQDTPEYMIHPLPPKKDRIPFGHEEEGDCDE